MAQVRRGGGWVQAGSGSSRRRRVPTSDGWVLSGPQTPGTHRIRPGAKPPRAVTITPQPDSGGPPAQWQPGVYAPGMTPEQIMAQAQAQAEAQLAAQQAGVERQRQAAMAAAQRDESAIQGLGFAQSKMLAPLPAEVAAINNQAGSAIAGYGKGYADQTQQAIQADQGANAADVAAQTGGTAQAAPTVDPAAVQRAVYAQGGEIPATLQSSVGAASANAAAGMPAVVSRAATEDIQQRMAEAAAQDADYRQQLLDLYAQRPQLVQDAVDRLNQIESDRFQQWATQQGLSQSAADSAFDQWAKTQDIGQ